MKKIKNGIPESAKPKPCVKHDKVFWISQWREMRWQAQQIVKVGASPNDVIQDFIDDFNDGVIKTKEILTDLILEYIMERTTPRERDDAQLNLFNEYD